MTGSEIAARTAEARAINEESIGRALRHALSVAGWSHADLAEVSGASRSIVSRWCRGDVGHGPTVLCRVFAALGLIDPLPGTAPDAPRRYRKRGTPATCCVDGCGRAYAARGYCSTHYERWRSHGDPQAHIPVRRNVSARLEDGPHA